MENTQVTLPREIIETIITRTKDGERVPESTMKTLEEAMRKAQNNEESKALLTDEENEMYGYGVYHTYAQTIIPIPSKSENTKTHVTKTWDENLLMQVKHQYGFESIDHLRIIRVTLANTIDKQEAREAINMKS